MDTSARTAFAALDSHHARVSASSLSDLFEADPDRFERFSARHASPGRGELLLDYSKCLLDDETVSLLAALAAATGVAAARDAMFSGSAINTTENRAALHVALRDRSGRPVHVAGRDVMGDVGAMLARSFAFAEAVRAGHILGATGATFTDIVNIGIGGSDLGPRMATEALTPFHDGPSVHFVSNVDGADLTDTLAGLDPARTLFIVASKTFATTETMTNAGSARAWLVARLGEAAVARHFAAVSSTPDRAAAFGITTDNLFGFWDWVGGRYSIWSAIGLPVMIAVGAERFAALLAGGHDMDQQFQSAPFARNLPMLLGMIGVWHRAVCRYPTRAVVPYAQRLARLPAFLQQLEMESNGKRVDLAGQPLQRAVGTVVWGAAGTDAQHSFFQLLHQGQETIPVEFVVAAHGTEPELVHHHRLLVANCLAQSEALAMGRDRDQVHARLVSGGASQREADRLAPHMTFPGNRPSVTILLERLDAFALGQLIALYEHRVLVEAAVHGINAFDQWGVELGKEIASALEPQLAGAAGSVGASAPTRGLLAAVRRLARGSP